mgnify:CR=1 FL=1
MLSNALNVVDQIKMENSKEKNVFDDSQFPKIIIRGLKSENLPYIMKRWFETYERGEPFTFFMDLRNSAYNMKDIKHSFVLAKFIQNIKKYKKLNYKYDLLQQSIVIVNNKLSNSFLNQLFKLQKPLSDTYILTDIEKANELYIQILNKQDLDLKNIKHVKPGKK